MNEFYTADLHLFHPSVAQRRGYDDFKDHDIHILENIVKTVKPFDTLHILGDLSKDEYTDEALCLLSDMLDTYNITAHLIAGNHDNFHPLHRNAHKSIANNLWFSSVRDSGTTKIAGKRAILSHFPYEGDHTSKDRYPQWRLRDLGAPIIHGHTHATTPVSRTSNGTLQVCVSVDAWDFKPVAKHELDKLITQELQHARHG